MATGQFQVTNVAIKQTPRLDANGKVWNATVVSFYVGPHGPFTLTFAPGQATNQEITDRITATVNQLIAQFEAINQLNQRTAQTAPQS
jgi:hypothetical protein